MKKKTFILIVLAVLAGVFAVGGCKQETADEIAANPQFPAVFPVSQSNRSAADVSQQRAARAEARAQAMAEAQTVTVSQVEALPHNTWVKITGNITMSIGRKYYTFQDSTGEITVEIGQRVWQDLSVGPENRIEITGKVEHKRDGRIAVEVKSIRMM